MKKIRLTFIAVFTVISSWFFYEKSTKEIVIEEIPEYSRKAYKHWVDADKDCQDTRQEVLIQESLTTPILDEKKCRVLSGEWYDPYTDRYFTNPRDLDVDHFVPLSEAHRSGAWRWGGSKKQKYANDLSDPNSLIAVYKGANRSKGDRDPANWLPKNEKYICDYVRIWVEIKKKWQLKIDDLEGKKIEDIDKKCGDE